MCLASTGIFCTIAMKNSGESWSHGIPGWFGWEATFKTISFPCHRQGHQVIPSFMQPGLGHFQHIQCQFVWSLRAPVTAQDGLAVPRTLIQEDSLQLLSASLDPEHSLADRRPWHCPADQTKPPGKGCTDRIPPGFQEFPDRRE